MKMDRFIGELGGCELFVINTEQWKSDGGPVFGVVPKAIWAKGLEVDDDNMIKTSNRNLLVKDRNRLVLIDTGMGDKQDEKFFRHKHIIERRDIAEEVERLGFMPEDVTDVVLTHLHYDHVGGAVKRVGEELVVVFKNARHWIARSQWDLAMNPNPREGASFIRENFVPLLDNNLVNFVSNDGNITDNISFRIFNGHTQGLIVPFIKCGDETVVFMTDFIPSAGNVPLPYVPAYDTQPLLTMKEKELFLNEAAEKGYLLFFQHDGQTESCKVHTTSKGVRMIIQNN